MSTFILHKSNISPLDRYRSNFYSQNGEDGVIAEILNRLGLTKNYLNLVVVEFGAWDGIFYSNTFRLVELGAKALYIEGSKSRFNILRKLSDKYKNVIPVNAYVSDIPNSKNTLNSILKSNSIPLDFDVLSIDVDGLDLDIYKNIGEYRPKVIIIEIVSEYGDILRNEDIPNRVGSTYSSTVDFLMSNNYSLICHIGNLIFIDNKYYNFIYKDSKYNSKNLYNPYWCNISSSLRALDLILAILLKYSYKILPSKVWGKSRLFLGL